MAAILSEKFDDLSVMEFRRLLEAAEDEEIERSSEVDMTDKEFLGKLLGKNDQILLTRDGLMAALDDLDRKVLVHLLLKIAAHKGSNSLSVNGMYVIPIDAPYAPKVRALIEEGEEDEPL